MSIFKKIFGRSSKKEATGEVADTISEVVDGIIEYSGLKLKFSVEQQENIYLIEFTGNDTTLLTEKDGQLLEALQFYTKRVVQHQYPEARVEVECDSEGFREKVIEELKELADRLRDVVVEKKKSVYFRALPPKDRKFVHQYLAEDERVKSKSVGEGHFKKIKIFPASGDKSHRSSRSSNTRSEERGNV
ncbi:MAG: hypothetical protein COT74_04185 [Bdellovibrionales bacterium CG10_big_fil_rev_8_21_14_0_10_45_34]|nr:MAG: hypothetical protein COT74_04185 [Bdellovibrionales bacterium CG10_big_fil_rev_8_21_14_0_10_45_34]